MIAAFVFAAIFALLGLGLTFLATAAYFLGEGEHDYLWYLAGTVLCVTGCVVALAIAWNHR